MRSLCLGLVFAVTLVAPALAEDNVEFPAPTPYYPFQRSVLTKRKVHVLPYARPFRVRIYTTPQQPPYYNVPPYRVISPY